MELMKTSWRQFSVGDGDEGAAAPLGGDDPFQLHGVERLEHRLPGDAELAGEMLLGRQLFPGGEHSGGDLPRQLLPDLLVFRLYRHRFFPSFPLFLL